MSLLQRTNVQPRLSSSFFDGTPELPPAQPLKLDFTDRPILGAIYKASGLAVAILGPTFWAALIALFLVAEFSPS